MAKHYTRNTVSAAKWCNKCSKETQHAVSDRRIAHCLECFADLQKKHDDRAAEKPVDKQETLF